MATTRRKVPAKRTNAYTAAVSPPRRYVAAEFVGKPFDVAVVAAHHDAVAAAPWLRGVATGTPAAEPSQRLRVLCVIPDVEVDYKVLDAIDDTRHSDDLAGETARSLDRRRRLADLKLHERLMAYIGEGSLCPEIQLDRVTEDGARRIDDVAFEVWIQSEKWISLFDYDVVFVDGDQSWSRCLAAAIGPRCVVVTSEPHRTPATVSALLRRVGDEVEVRRAQQAMPWAPPLPVVPTPSLDDAEVDAMVTAA